jgi:type IV secretion system protein VirD4
MPALSGTRATALRDDWLALCVVAFGAVWVVLWSAACLSARLSGSPAPRASFFAPFAAFAHPGDPGAAWHTPVGAAGLYWSVTLLLTAAATGLVLLVVRLARSHHSDTTGLSRLAGTRGPV